MSCAPSAPNFGQRRADGADNKPIFLDKDEFIGDATPLKYIERARAQVIGGKTPE